MSTAVRAQMKGFFEVKAVLNDTHGQVRSLQADRRRPESYTDQHGRVYYAEADVVNGHPCSPLVADGWRAPIECPADLRTFGKGRHNSTFVIDYDRWEERNLRLEAEWESEFQRAAQQLYPNSWAKEMELQNPAILREVGTRPLSTVIIRAAKSGDRWALGQSAIVPAWALKVEPRTGAVPVGTIPKPTRRVTASELDDFDFSDDREPTDSEEIAAKLEREAKWLELNDDAPRPRGRAKSRTGATDE